MTIEDLKEIVQGSKFRIDDIKDIPYGKCMKLTNGAIINCYDKGTINVQGKNTEEIENLLGLGSSNNGNENKIYHEEVFIVYGHDEEAKTQLEAMLRRWGLKPLILDQLPSEGQTIIEKLEKHTSNANFCIVLATPDDIGYRKKHEDEKAFRARQNVVLELGMMLSKLGRDRVAILLKNQEDMERPSDIQGLIYVPYNDEIKEAGVILAKEMSRKGYDIDIRNL